MKKYLLGTLAIALAVGFSSFTGSSNKWSATWYGYTGVFPQTTASREAPLSYTKLTGGDPLCDKSTNECGVQMPTDNGTNPNFTGITFDTGGFPHVDGVKVLANEKQN